MVGRRGFLAGSIAAVAGACRAASDQPTTPTATSIDVGQPTSSNSNDRSTSSRAATTTQPFVPGTGAAPFGLGVASGDPSENGFVIWTRLADGAAGNPVVKGEVRVRHMVSTTPDMSDIVIDDGSMTSEELGHSVHVTITGLTPNREWFYAFEIDDVRSPVGRSITLGPSGTRRIILASCQHYEDGFFGAWRHATEELADLVVHVGDAIYTRGGVGEAVRTHGSTTPESLDEYRRRYSLYRADPDLQAAHASLPWCAVWDDNEFVSDFAGAGPNFDDARLIAAHRAWWEHNPVRSGPPLDGEPFEIDRTIEFGGLADVWLLDGRQYRSGQVCDRLSGLPAVERCAAVDDASRTMLGQRQENRLRGGLESHGGRWQIIAQQTVMADFSVDVGEDTGINNDQWDGYAAARDRLLQSIGDAKTVVLSGDIHAGAVTELDVDGSVVAHEIVAPSITTKLDPVVALGLMFTVGAKPNVHHFNTSTHGYVVVDITKDSFTAAFRDVSTTSTPGRVSSGPTAIVTPGRQLTVEQ